ncbi:TetR/AcrR family transcriptional regulator [Pseudomonas gingeri]|uniref:TetR/AcrR family transcriptional regulator n=1 Tax=Pseudomonas gingeri TaxID=117681 RepID=UPI0015A01758|nr:TetR/AcrR family transcriptional regulator [Pseudomonas gingeri]NWA02245.1 TetR/AcrR family transcriptional regulator [Pseudomonas gingeri]NWA17886.1 TetR/AcrR family transcriptional regulator [Pseudomonas gingeri]NWA56799.1 TetR/AcrR family transcriptional regulator [Pseudomonas gingeri]NWA97102.1 TetR/AcrR family transcriptional regulator [Pseudomonas gingeri]NWB03697.1 TetR/AcrR family transcriptional regulator [Pseudomonas gingeri]
METPDLLERCYPGRRAELKRAILRQALLCFNEQGIEASTIETIRAACDTSVGAIYHHFGNKEGLVAALFFTALEDQARLREAFLAEARTLKEVLQGLVYSYVDWVDEQPEWARFQFQARFVVSKGPFAEELATRNRARNRQLRDWLGATREGTEVSGMPRELLLSLIVGPAENYCRAWLAGRVQSSPRTWRSELAEAAWKSLQP